LWKKHDSGLDKGHYFVLAPLGGIRSCFRAREFVGVTHVLDAVLMNSRDLWLGRSVERVREICSSGSVMLGWCGIRRLQSANRTIEDFLISASKFEPKVHPLGGRRLDNSDYDAKAARTYVRFNIAGTIVHIASEPVAGIGAGPIAA
jgi:hypothetical protein